MLLSIIALPIYTVWKKKFSDWKEKREEKNERS